MDGRIGFDRFILTLWLTLWLILWLILRLFFVKIVSKWGVDRLTFFFNLEILRVLFHQPSS
ncbi:MAG: hypothetical protein ACK496_13205 [Acidobacteriota bacterium]